MLRHAVAVAVALITSACGSAESPGSGGGGGASSTAATASGCSESDTFLPFESSFTGYHGWDAFHLDHGTIADGVHNVDAPLTAYLNKRPNCASGFPIGTIIVKEVEQGSIETRKIFAMVKRGGGFNPEGARGWEWWELTRNPGAGDTVRMIWRGVGPPKGEMYGGDGMGVCNSCHAGAKENDFVWSSALQLKALEQ